MSKAREEKIAKEVSKQSEKKTPKQSECLGKSCQDCKNYRCVVHTHTDDDGNKII